jgi:hypothetical protein
MPNDGVKPPSGDQNKDAIGRMEDAFNRAIDKSAEITAKTTGWKVELDAAKQRPNN